VAAVVFAAFLIKEVKLGSGFKATVPQLQLEIDGFEI
jgi:hypothetical protein